MLFSHAWIGKQKPGVSGHCLMLLRLFRQRRFHPMTVSTNTRGLLQLRLKPLSAKRPMGDHKRSPVVDLSPWSTKHRRADHYPALETIDWLWIVHPVLAVVLIYPLIGVVVRLGIQTKARRVDGAKLPPSTGRDHSAMGRWLSAGVVVLSLIALTVVIATKVPIQQFPGGVRRILELCFVLLGTVVSLISLCQVKSKVLRLAFAFITWAGVIALGSQPEVYRLSDNPFQVGFWQSHYWAGISVVGLMLFSLGARPEILSNLRWRRIHVAVNILAALLFVIQGLTGTRDLLQIPLHWQKSALANCNWTTLVCPPTPHG
jgi:hypothetical protein